MLKDMKLQIKVRNDIHWLFLFILILRVIGINDKIFFILSAIYLCILILQLKKLYFPNIRGLVLYSWFIIYGTIIGIVMYPIRYVLRDLYYIIPTIVWIFIGFYLSKKSLDNRRILKTIYIYGVLNSTVCIINFVMNFSTSFDNLRNIFGLNVYDIGFILPIMIYETVLYTERIFGRKIDLYSIVIMSIQIILSFGRASVFVPIVILFTLLYLELKNKKKSIKVIKLFIVFSIAFLIITILLIYILPKDVLDTFINKISNSFNELQQSQDINSIGDAQSNWRSYEMQAATKEWKNSNILIKLLGLGIGKGTTIEYIPYYWREFIVDNQAPLLHNGFYTLLMKGGLFGLFSLIWIFLGNIIKSCKIIKKNTLNRRYAIVIIAISCGAILNTYVVRGPIQQGTFLVWAVLLGCMSCKINQNSCD